MNYSSFSQTVDELEHKLSVFVGGETYAGKIDEARQLLKIDPFNEKAIRLTLDYYQEKKLDSISLFFDQLIAQHPDNNKPLLIRSQLLFYEHDYRKKSEYTKWQIKYLNKALKLNPVSKESLYYLSEAYYKDFIYPYEKNEIAQQLLFGPGEEVDSTLLNIDAETKISAFEHSADSALHYFYKLWRIDSNRRDIIYFPIKQLECFLDKNVKSPVDNGIEEISNDCYFPSWYFANLPKDWECNYTNDYLFKVELSKWNANGMRLQLTNLEEPCLYKTEVQQDKEIYRFTWLRSFDNPISIRIQKSNKKIELYWKVGKGSGGYEPMGIKRKGKKKIKASQWNEFVSILNESEFEKLPNQTYVLMTDGASWTLEHKTNTNFKAHDTNWPEGDFRKSCLYLLKLSGIKIKEKNIY